MPSIRTRLFSILIITTGLVWLSAVTWIFFSTRAQVEHVLDARLMESARMVSSLVGNGNAAGQAGAAPGGALPIEAMSVVHGRQLLCQIWSIHGKLISKSSGAPSEEMSSISNGFSEAVIAGETWRVYAVESADGGVRVLVGDNLKVRDQLVNDVIKGLLLPAVLILPILAGLIWFSVGRGLRPLNRIEGELASREASDLHPIEDDQTASEITPVLRSLNGLFSRVASARERERNFTAFAAHELRTPLAGLKTQAQVALASNDNVIREQALGQIVVGVDRTTRLVRQLLDIAALESSDDQPAGGQVNPGLVLNSLTGELLVPQRHQVRIEIAPELAVHTIEMGADLFRLAARNLLENAINHSPADHMVTCKISVEGHNALITIDDNGPGVGEDELPHLMERFFRGRCRAPIGSGLGLSIAELALEHGGGRLELSNLAGGGFRAAMAVRLA